MKLTNAAILNNMTVWGSNDKTDSAFMNNAFAVYYSADGTTYTLVDRVNNMCGDGVSTAGVGAKKAYYTATVGTDTYYGVNFDMGGVTAGYVAIAVSEIAKYDRITFREITFNDAEQTPPADEGGDEVVGPTQMGIGIQSIEMPWYGFDALIGANADKQACSTKMYDGNLNTVVVWRHNDLYEPTQSQLEAGKTSLIYNGSMVDNKLVSFDGTADGNDFYDYIIMDLSNDTENKTYNVGTFRWWVGGEPANLSKDYSVYYSTDGETWTLAEQFTDMSVNYGKTYVYDKESGLLYHDVKIDAENVRYVMLTIEHGRNDKDFLMWNVTELVVYEKGTEPVETPEENDNNNNNNNNNNTNPKPQPKPNTDTQATDTNAPETQDNGATGGCGSNIGMGIVAVVAATGAAVSIIRKKKED